MNDFIFADEVLETSNSSLKPWKILISDDEKEIHTITKIVLSNFNYENRPIEILDAYSRIETLDILEKNKDIAVLLLDVVMETDDSGLLVARDIREKLNNKLIRIILRTGQPGSAPEKDVISKYDINDYKEKTELTTTKLFTTVMTALRSYRDLHTIEQNKKGLEQILKSTKNIMEIKTDISFAESVLKEITNLILVNKHLEIRETHISGLFLDVKNETNFELLTSTGKFKNMEHDLILNKDVTDRLQKAVSEENSYYGSNYYTGHLKNDNGITSLVYLESNISFSNSDKNLIDIFSNNVAVAFNNVLLTHEILDTQKEIIETLSEVVEKRSKETSNHVLRVAQVSRFLALKLGLPEDEANKIAMASPLHDIGKTGIPDAILLKPGKLTSEEYETMKLHTQIGRDILGSSQRPLLKAASIISYEHHEKWDGSGYPNGKSGEDIHVYGRITALADVFDALYHKRCYKDAWPLEEIIELVKKEKGKHFDPQITEIFLNNLDTILQMIKDLD